MSPQTQYINEPSISTITVSNTPTLLLQQKESTIQDRSIISRILKSIQYSKLLSNYLSLIQTIIDCKVKLRNIKYRIDNNLLNVRNIYDISSLNNSKDKNTYVSSNLFLLHKVQLDNDDIPKYLTEKQKLMYKFILDYYCLSEKKITELSRHFKFSKCLSDKALKYLVFRFRCYPYNTQLIRNEETKFNDQNQCINYFKRNQDKELQDYRNHLINYLLEDTQENAIITLIQNEIEDNNKLLQFNSTEKEEIKRRVLNSKELIKINKDLIINNLLDKEKVEEEIQENEGNVYMTKTQFEMHNATLDKLLLLSNRLLALKEKCEYYAPHISCPYNYSQCVEYIPLQRELEEIKIQINFLSLKNFQIPEPNYQFIQLFIKYNVINALKVTRLLRCLRNKKNFDPSDLELQFIGGEQLYEEILNCSAKDKCLFEIENKCYLEDLLYVK